MLEKPKYIRKKNYSLLEYIDSKTCSKWLILNTKRQSESYSTKYNKRDVYSQYSGSIIVIGIWQISFFSLLRILVRILDQAVQVLTARLTLKQQLIMSEHVEHKGVCCLQSLGSSYKSPILTDFHLVQNSLFIVFEIRAWPSSGKNIFTYSLYIVKRSGKDDANHSPGERFARQTVNRVVINDLEIP
jgi:hypothetical protein